MAEAKPEEDLDQLDIDLEATEEDIKEEEPEFSVAETKAMDDGWRPEEDWEGETDDWVSAKEFNFRGELMAKITSQSGQISDYNKKVDKLSNALNVLGEHHKKTAETEHKRILKSLKKEKALALEEEDTNAVVEIDDKIADLKESKKEEAAQIKEDEKEVKDASKDLPPAIAKWFKDPKNEWYHNDPIRRAIADTVSVQYIEQHGENDLAAMLEHVDKVVRAEMPHKFKGNAPKTSKVTESGGATRSKSKKFSRKDLDEDQLDVAKTFVDMGVYPNVQAFVDELVKNGDLN